MDLAQIKSLTSSSESHILEFKTSTAQLKSAFETVCAFLNGSGGTVLIGVNNKGQILGQDVSDATFQEVAREINKIEPTTQIEIHHVPVNENKYIIAIQAVSNNHMPYTYDGRAFQRNQTTTVRMTQHRYEQLLVQRGQLNYSWEKLPTKDYHIDLLDAEEIRRTIKDGVDKNRIPIEVLTYDVPDILHNLDLIKQGKLTNAAVILFAKDVFLNYAHCLIRMARFRGTEKLGDFMDNQRIYGNAFKILSAANQFMMRHLPINSFFETNRFDRIDKLTLPVLAVREALINAISHRDYTNHSASISLTIFDDRLEIWNNGGLPPQLKIPDLKKRHESYPRNELIATIFYKRGWVEGWGTGTVRMIERCREANIPQPEFEEYSGGFAVIFRFKESLGVKFNRSSDGVLLNPRQEKILQILHDSDKPLNSGEIFAKLRSVSSLRTIKADLSALQKLKLLVQHGKGRSTVWKLTDL
jgi:ATP-dependent DNA helicase RecG